MASTPVDIYIHDTYFIVAHIHYVVFGGSIFGVFAAIYFWFPKMFGRMMNATLGHLHFWPTFVFFNVTFFPMHIIGVGGHMRRIYNPMQYEFLQPLQHWNVIMTIGALGLGALADSFIINFFWSLFAGKRAPKNPWNANTLEWDARLAAAARQLRARRCRPCIAARTSTARPTRAQDFSPQTQPRACAGRGVAAH